MLLAIFVVSLFSSHLLIANIPSAYVFDEVAYVPEALNIINRSWISTYHPPLAKILMASSILVFGNNGLGWRFPSIVFGVCSIIVLYLATKKIGSVSVALLAAILFGLDNLVFVQSSIATLDIFFVFFMILGFYFYLNDNFRCSSLSMSLSCLSKVTGVLGIAVVLGHFILTHRRSRLKFVFQYLTTFLIALLVLLTIFDYVVGTNLNALEHLREVFLSTPSARTGAERPTLTIESLPWTWITNPQAIPYYVVPKILDGTVTFPIAYQGIGNPLIWLLTIPAMVSTLHLYVKKRESLPLFTLLWFAFTYVLPWYPATLFHRAMYIYYFLPTVGAVCIAISTMLKRIPKVKIRGHQVELNKYIGLAYVFAILNLFLIYFPVKSF